MSLSLSELTNTVDMEPVECLLPVITLDEANAATAEVEPEEEQEQPEVKHDNEVEEKKKEEEVKREEEEQEQPEAKHDEEKKKEEVKQEAAAVVVEFAVPRLPLRETNKIVSKEFEPVGNSDDIFNAVDTLGFDPRRESLFNLKDKIHGKVSKQINEIENRKQSPYKFLSSTLKITRKVKETTASPFKSNTLGKHKSPLRVPSIFSKKSIKETLNNIRNTENLENLPYLVKAPTTPSSTSTANTASVINARLSKTIATSSGLDKRGAAANSPRLPIESPLLVRAASQFYRKFNKNRSVKRLNSTQLFSTLKTDKSAKSSKEWDDEDEDVDNVPSKPKIFISTELKCTNESIDL